MLSKTKISRYLLLLALMIGGFLLAKNVFALDVGTNEISNTIQLGTSDPRTIVARIINVAMMFLGIIAVAIIIFAGFKWMTSQGNEEQIEAAKKILKAGVIGLVIILASWGIAAFILNRLLGATGNGGTGGNTTGGGGILPPCSGNGCVGMACDDLPLMPGCNYSTSSCQTGLACAPSTCTCQPCPPGNPNCATNPPGSFGDACDGDLTNNDPSPTCDADNTMCDSNQGLTCDANTCTCLGSPVITDVSPVGGFCDGDNNKACDVDADCVGGTGPCNTDTPNGAANNIISIHGYNFGTSSTSTAFNTYRSNNVIAKIKRFLNLGVYNTKAAGLSQVVFLGDEGNLGDDKVGLNPTVINPVCNDAWTNNEIIVAIPAGASNGPLKVVNGNLNSNLIDFDTTNNTTGPQIPNFVSNSIIRPGICRITPDAGALGDSVSYYGNNLSGSGYFGNEANKFKGISSTFNTANTSGQVLVPNVGAGHMSTFVVNTASQRSNYVAFRKNQEPPVSPSISGFEPATGSAGQYVTVRGSGFGNSRGASQLFFESTEASYNFPAACLHSVWSDNQVIVKVPAGLANGAYTLKMKIGAWDMISSANTFTANSAASLLPSLCKVEPSRGPANSQVSFYGEYFSSSTIGIARFYNQKDASGNITNDAGANKLKANVPLDAVTGPVKIVDNSRVGNSLNFMVGACTNNTECDSGTPYCCPFGSPKQGQCTLALMDSNNGCYTNIPTSVFEWKFGTSLAIPCDGNLNNNDPNPTCDASNQLCSSVTTFCDSNSCTCQPCPASDPNCGIGSCGDGGATCNPNDNLCSAGYVCDPTACECVESFYSCAQKGGGDSCPTGFCPNSPGQCSPYAGGNSQTIGTCKDDCSNVFGCTGGNCAYDSSLNKCVHSSNTCNPSEPYPYTLGVDPYSTSHVAERVCVGATNSTIGHWRITVSSVCPDGWTNIGGNKCELLSGTCNKCTPNFSCNSDGKCVNNNVICATGSVCQGNECRKDDSATCECCCEIGQDDRDCCAPLTCAGTCGNGAYTDQGGVVHNFGKCSGCSAVGGTQDDHDAACNCAGTSGKFCQDDGGSGVCVDCTDLSKGDCTAHASTCCWDDKDGTCRGGDGKKVSSNPADIGKYGHCAFYACANTTTNQCASSTPNIYSTSTSLLANYVFKNSNQCSGCADANPNAACAAITASSTCMTKSGCCWDMGTTTPICTSGNKIPTNGVTPGACDYFDCQIGNDQCVATSSAQTSGHYATWNACSAGCKTPHLGASCSSFATTTSFTTQTCNVSMCGGAGFNCMVSTNPYMVTSSTPATAGGCGFCCCDPNAVVDACKDINANLSCYANKGNCTGGNRGLCCGCQNDSQCGNANTLGCSFDSCCHARPSVVTTSPTPGMQNVCRNSVISITFSEKMDNTSLNNNFVLLSESATGNCPAGTSHLAMGEAGNSNIFARIFNQIIGVFRQVSTRIARIFNPNQAIAYSIDPHATYCVTPGISIYETTSTTTILKFTPATALQANTNYVAVVKGQNNLNSLASSTALGLGGVLSSYKIGMAGNGLKDISLVPVSFTVNPFGGPPHINYAPLFPFGPFGTDGPTFNNSYSWSFKTLSAGNATSGFCLVDSVDLSPPGYIFQKNTNDTLVENDASSIDPTFDTSFDRDKVYSARALSSNGLELQPVANYGWTWNWTISDIAKINFTSGTDLPDNGNRRLLSVQTGITDAQVDVTASTVMNSGNAYSTPSKNKVVPATVFVCANPWPPVNNYYEWSPSKDLAGPGYAGYNYEFYYCRDAGGPGFEDDLPAISSGSDIINLGLSSRKVCSNSRSTECSVNSDCPSGGFCIYDILKESYFFQQ